MVTDEGIYWKERGATGFEGFVPVCLSHPSLGLVAYRVLGGVAFAAGFTASPV